MRTGIQLLFLGVFTLLFFCNGWGETVPVPGDLFLRIDPLVAVLSCIASRHLHYNLLLSLTVVVSALFAGRFFCGYVCPLGTLFDLAGRIARKKKRYQLCSVKYYILTFLVACALFGVNLAYLFDPIAFLTRAYTFLLNPAAVFTANLGLDAVRPAADTFNLVYLAHKHFHQPIFLKSGITFVLFLFVFILNFFTHRFWCRYLCPLGALLGLLARFRAVRRHVGTACNSCMKCYQDCPMGAVAPQPRTTREDECILCGTCASICPQQAISFPPGAPLFVAPQPSGAAAGRRAVLATAGGVLAACAFRAMPASATMRRRLLRPPGSVPEQTFLRLCVRCGECMKVCPTNTLQPCLFESSLEGIWSPRLFARLAGCDQTCKLCGTVCPTGAIRNLTLEEKKHAKIGTAVIDEKRCLVWEEDKLCLICDEQCPYNAIVFRWEKGFRRPFVVDNKCNGCGFCEEQCPVEGEAAIIVTAQDEMRLARGSYIEKARELQLHIEEDPGDDGFFFDDDITPGTLPKGFRK